MTIKKKAIEAIYPLSPSQKGMLFETYYASESGIHIEQAVCILRGKLDLVAFKQAWQQIVDHHPILRTSIVGKERDEPLQVVHKQSTVSFEQYNWQSYAAADQQKRLEDYIEADRRKGFNLSKPPLVRLVLFQVMPDTYQLVWTHHHILMDGWCTPLIFEEFLSRYKALTENYTWLPKPSRPYKDYIVWLQLQNLSEAEHFWAEKLKGFTKPTPLGLPNTVSGSDVSRNSHHNDLKISVPVSTTSSLEHIARQARITLNTLFQGVWSLLLSCYSGHHDILFGTTVSGRPQELAGIETTLGLFINTLPCRVYVEPSISIIDWLKDIQAQHLELRRYEYCSTGQIHQWSAVPPSEPLYDSLVVFENYPTNGSISGTTDLSVDRHTARSKGAQTNYPLTILVTKDSQLHIRFIFNHRIGRESVEQIAAHFQLLLASIASDSNQFLQNLQDKVPAHQIPKIAPPHRFDGQKQSESLVAPANQVEETLAELWKDVLELDQISVQDSFFELGGHSLLATQVISRIRQVFQIELPLRSLFEKPTISELATHIIQNSKTGEKFTSPPPIKSITRSDSTPLSFAQHRLWFLDQLDPSSTAYNVPISVRLCGSLNISVLNKCFAEIIRRHEILRTTFHTRDRQPIQIVAPAIPVPFLMVDLQMLSKTDQNIEIQRLTIEEARKPFDLSCGPLVRITLLKLGADDSILILTLHHIISDGWSLGVIVQEISALYMAFLQGNKSPLPELPIQYADFAIWQQQWLQGNVLQQLLDYWTQQLEGAPATLSLQTDWPRPAAQTYQGAVEGFTLSQSLTQALKDLCQKEDVTLYMILLTAFQSLLYHYSGQEDFVIGSPIANRNRSEIEGLIGYFANTLVMRTDLRGNPSFRTLLKRTRQVTLDAYSHQDLPFELLVKALQPDRKLDRNPLFQICFVFQNAPMPNLALPDLTISPLEEKVGKAIFDLTLSLTDTDNGLTGVLDYNADLFAHSTIRLYLNHFQTILERVVEDPALCLLDIPLLDTTEDSNADFFIDLPMINEAEQFNFE